MTRSSQSLFSAVSPTTPAGTTCRRKSRRRCIWPPPSSYRNMLHVNAARAPCGPSAARTGQVEETRGDCGVIEVSAAVRDERVHVLGDNRGPRHRDAVRGRRLAGEAQILLIQLR